jgi:hypothetical protein
MRATFRDPELQADLERDGYVAFPMLSDDEVARLRASYAEIGSAPGDPHVACHSSFHSYDRDYKLRVDAAVRAVLGPHLDRLLDRQRYLPCNFIVKWPSGMSGFGLHQDLALVDERRHRSVEVWVALDDTTPENGQLWMVPGSHEWVPTLRGIHAFPSPFVEVARRIIDHHSRPVPVRAGDAIVFTHPVLHFSLPNRSQQPRMVAITDLIPEEADHLHYFGDGQGNVDVYRIDDSFWTDNSPFTLWKPPPASSRIGTVTDFEFRRLTDDDLDRLVAEGRAVVDEGSPRGAINAAKSWCHRCGAAGFGDEAPDRMMGNVTMLCPSCQEAELQFAASAAHVGA